MEQLHNAANVADLTEGVQPKGKSLWLRFVPINLKEGTVLEGGIDLLNGLYFLIDGKAELHFQLREPAEMHVKYNSGSMPGAFLLLHPQNLETCHIHITGDSSFLFLEKGACFQLMGNSPDFAMMVLEQVSAELSNIALITSIKKQVH